MWCTFILYFMIKVKVMKDFLYSLYILFCLYLLNNFLFKIFLNNKYCEFLSLIKINIIIKKFFNIFECLFKK